MLMRPLSVFDLKSMFDLAPGLAADLTHTNLAPGWNEWRRGRLIVCARPPAHADRKPISRVRDRLDFTGWPWNGANWHGETEGLMPRTGPWVCSKRSRALPTAWLPLPPREAARHIWQAVGRCIPKQGASL